jgi:hypothetical protein
MIYKRGKYYWYEFEFCGRRYRKSTDIIAGKGNPGEKSPKELARDVETAKRHELALAAVGIQPPAPEEPKPDKPTLATWAKQWLDTYAKGEARTDRSNVCYQRTLRHDSEGGFLCSAHSRIIARCSEDIFVPMIILVSNAGSKET